MNFKKVMDAKNELRDEVEETLLKDYSEQLMDAIHNGAR